MTTLEDHLHEELEQAREARDAADRYKRALEAILEEMGPAKRQQFVSRGPLAFAGIYNIAKDALDGKETA